MVRRAGVMGVTARKPRSYGSRGRIARTGPPRQGAHCGLRSSKPAWAGRIRRRRPVLTAIRAPQVRELARQFNTLSLAGWRHAAAIAPCNDKARPMALAILVRRFEKGDAGLRKRPFTPPSWRSATGCMTWNLESS